MIEIIESSDFFFFVQTNKTEQLAAKMFSIYF